MFNTKDDLMVSPKVISPTAHVLHSRPRAHPCVPHCHPFPKANMCPHWSLWVLEVNVGVEI